MEQNRQQQNIALVGFGEALSAPEVAWSLHKAGFRVIAFGRKGKRSCLRHSRLVELREITSPESDLEACLRELVELMGTLGNPEGSNILMPLDDASVYLCSRLEGLPGRWRLAGPEGDCAVLALDKEVQIRIAGQSGLRVPQTWVLHSTSDGEAFLRQRHYPVIFKAADCAIIRGGRLSKGKVWICETEDEVRKALKEWNGAGRLIAQDFVTGVGEGVFGLATRAGVLAWSGHRRLRMMNPHGSGSSACISRSPDAEVRPKIEALLESTGWTGMFMVELLRDGNGDLWFIELNGRPWGSMALSRRQGLEYPAWQAKLALGEALPEIDLSSLRENLVCRNVGREILHLLFVVRGPRSAALLPKWPPFWGTLLDLVQVRKGERFYNWNSADWRVFFADCADTILNTVFKSKA